MNIKSTSTLFENTSTKDILLNNSNTVVTAQMPEAWEEEKKGI